MKINFLHLLTMNLFVSLVSINAMEQSLPVKLGIIKTHLETLQEKFEALKIKLVTLKDTLQPESPISEEDEEKSLLEQAWEWAEKKIAEDEAEVLRQEQLLGIPQTSISEDWYDEWVTPYIPSIPGLASSLAPAFSSSTYGIEGAGKPAVMYIKKPNPDGLPYYKKIQYTPPLEISTEPLPPLPQMAGVTFDFRVSEGSMPNYSLSQYDSGTHAQLSQKTFQDFKEMFQPVFSKGDIPGAECAILSNYELYAYPGFLAYVREFRSHDDYILALQKKIKTDSKFRGKTFKMYGFGYNSIPGFRYSEFHNLVKALADKAIERRCAQARCLIVKDMDIVKKLSEEYTQKSNAAKKNDDKELANRYDKRIKAFNRVGIWGKRIDYSSKIPKHPTFTDSYASVFDACYGTELDQVLHEELCDTRVIMFFLQDKYGNNPNIESYAQMINRITALAKKEQDVEKAFNFANFSRDLVDIVSAGVKGVTKEVKKRLDPDYWKSIPEHLKAIPGQILNLGIFLIDATAAFDDLDTSLAASIFSGDADLILGHSNEFKKHYQELSLAFQKSVDQMIATPMNDIIEHGTALCTSVLLDGVVLKAGSLFVSASGRAATSGLAKIMKSPLAGECVVEIGTVGKITLEEGAEFTAQAIDALKNNPTLLAGKGKKFSQSVLEVVKDCKWTMPEKGKMINGRWYTIHALERMAPDTFQVRAILESRALKRYPRGSKEFKDYVQPRGIPPMVVEDTIQNGIKKVGEKIGTLEIKGPSITVIIGETSGNVITIYPK